MKGKCAFAEVDNWSSEDRKNKSNNARNKATNERGRTRYVFNCA